MSFWMCLPDQNEADSMASSSTTSTVAVDTLRSIQTLQRDRVSTYARFEQALRDMLLDNDAEKYRSAALEATVQFRQISERVMALMGSLLSEHETHVRGILQRLQALEKENLANTAALHRVRVAIKNARDQLERDDDMEMSEHHTACSHGHDQYGEVIRGEKLHLLEREMSGLQKEQQRVLELIQDEMNEIQALLFV